MNILIGDKDNVDFSEPIKMTKEQEEKFIEFMKSILSVVYVEHKEYQLRKERVGDKPEWPQEWEIDEYETLLRIETTDDISNRLGRSWMSVNMKRGIFIGQFQSWAAEKNIDLIKGNIKELIKDFFKEKEEYLKTKREERKRVRNRPKEIDHDIETLKKNMETFKRIVKIGYPLHGVNVEMAKEKLKDIKKRVRKLEEEKIEILEKGVISS